MALKPKLAKVFGTLSGSLLVLRYISIAKDFVYLLPQLATIYYAGRRGLTVRTDTEAFIGIPVTAFLPDIKLIIDVCSSVKEKKLKGYNPNKINISLLGMI